MEKQNRRVIKKAPLDIKKATLFIYKAMELREEDVYGIIKQGIKQNYTEPLAREILPQVLSDNFTYELGGGADITATDENGNTYTVEIKSTLESGFTRLGKKDIVADYLVWVNFNDFFASRDNTHINVYISKNVKPNFDRFAEEYEKNKDPENDKTAEEKLHTTLIEEYYKIMEGNLTTVKFNLKEFIFN